MAKSAIFLSLAAGLAGAVAGTVQPTDLTCEPTHIGEELPPVPSKLQPMAIRLLPLGQVTPTGWLLDQLVLQANALSGYLPVSTFPGASDVNGSLWMNATSTAENSGTTQWLPYWTNGNVPLVALIDAANATDRLDKSLNLQEIVAEMMKYILAHTNKTNGWIGPFVNEPGDFNGHGLWDPLNMLRTLINYGQYVGSLEKEIAQACFAHMAEEAKLLVTDPVYKWAQTRWPTFNEIAYYMVDHYVPKYCSDRTVCPLGAAGATAMLLNASVLFSQKGMDWKSYYHQTGPIQFPEGSVPNWNTNDHGVNNAEGAIRWPAASWRLSGSAADKSDMAFMLGMLDKYQGQANAMMCADEVFCGRAPNRGTETCAVVEAMASLEYAYEVFGDVSLMDRVERLAFNALPASLTADMWTHVYVQQANSVFAGNTHPQRADDPSLRAHHLDSRHGACATCGGGGGGGGGHSHGVRNLMEKEEEGDAAGGKEGRTLGPDRPSGEDQGANFYGVSHFPCCITNFPQGWPKFAMHTIMATAGNAFVVASLVPSKATLFADVGGGATVVVESQYPFGDSATITVVAAAATTGLVRIPGWATKATVNGAAAKNGTLVSVPCSVGTTLIKVELHPEVRMEFGWGEFATPAGSAVLYSSAGATVPTTDGPPTPADGDPYAFGGAGTAAAKAGKGVDIRSGGPGQNTTATIMHPVVGNGHYLDSIELSFSYCAGYTPAAGKTAAGSTVSVAVVDMATMEEIATVYTSPPLSNYSCDKFTGYSPPVAVAAKGLKIPNAKPVLIRLKFADNQRDVQVHVDAATGLAMKVGWTAELGPGKPEPAPKYTAPASNGAAVLRGPLLFSLHPKEQVKTVKNYSQNLPYRPKAVDLEISTADTWNYGLVIDSAKPFAFSAAPSKGWEPKMAFDTENYPFSIEASAKQVSSWGYWSGSKITDNIPASPIDCSSSASACGAEETIKLVPFGGTNIRIGVFPWTSASARTDA